MTAVLILKQQIGSVIISTFLTIHADVKLLQSTSVHGWTGYQITLDYVLWPGEPFLFVQFVIVSLHTATEVRVSSETCIRATCLILTVNIAFLQNDLYDFDFFLFIVKKTKQKNPHHMQSLYFLCRVIFFFYKDLVFFHSHLAHPYGLYNITMKETID